jgi:hypothetical protein
MWGGSQGLLTLMTGTSRGTWLGEETKVTRLRRNSCASLPSSAAGGPAVFASGNCPAVLPRASLIRISQHLVRCQPDCTAMCAAAASGGCEAAL